MISRKRITQVGRDPQEPSSPAGAQPKVNPYVWEYCPDAFELRQLGAVITALGRLLQWPATLLVKSLLITAWFMNAADKGTNSYSKYYTLF